MTLWDKSVRWLRTLRLDTMRGKFMVFAVSATLFTTLVVTVMLYGTTRRSLGDRVGQELRGASSDAAREMGVWLDERLYDLRLRASPYVVSDNLARATGRNGPQSFDSATTSIPSGRTWRRTRGSPFSGATGRCWRAAAAARGSACRWSG
jgi:hypothetical protein